MVAANILVFLGVHQGGVSEETLTSMILHDESPAGLLGYQFLHFEFFHLLGNLIFLWTFGNALNANMGNVVYLLLYLTSGILAGLLHLGISHEPVIGASGAINGMVGLSLAMYPVNRIHVFWLFFIRAGTFSCQLWIMAILWLLFDLYGVISGGGGVAYWAHIGGFAGGLVLGMIAMQFGWIRLTEYDNRSLLEMIKGEYPE